MFGYVTPNKNDLSAAEEARYRAFYCGVCASLRERYGAAARFALDYDMAFLAMLLSSLYDGEQRVHSERCPSHPVKAQAFIKNRFTDYASDVNILLAYYKCLDDYNDEGKKTALFAAKRLEKSLAAAAARRSAQAEAISRSLALLSRFEAEAAKAPSDGASPFAAADEGAGIFGSLMAALFVPMEEDVFAPVLARTGDSLGRFIYIMDAWTDAESDRKKGRFNPLPAGAGEEELHALLTMLIGRCAEEFEKLPLVDDIAIMRNVIYSGVWTRYEAEKLRRAKKGGLRG